MGTALAVCKVGLLAIETGLVTTVALFVTGRVTSEPLVAACGRDAAGQLVETCLRVRLLVVTCVTV